MAGVDHCEARQEVKDSAASKNVSGPHSCNLFCARAEWLAKQGNREQKTKASAYSSVPSYKATRIRS